MLIYQHWKPLQLDKKRGVDLDNNNLDKEFQQKLANVLEKESWHLGIGDVENATGISQTKLRYWERKGYITSVKGKSQNRKFTYATLMKVYQMKYYLDKGYTLAAAAEKADSKNRILTLFKQFLFDRYRGVEEIDGHTAINLGTIAGDSDQLLLAVFTDEGTELQLISKKDYQKTVHE